jgi:hypothetical protein
MILLNLLCEESIPLCLSAFGGRNVNVDSPKVSFLSGKIVHWSMAIDGTGMSRLSVDGKWPNAIDGTFL